MVGCRILNSWLMKAPPTTNRIPMVQERIVDYKESDDD